MNNRRAAIIFAHLLIMTISGLVFIVYRNSAYIKPNIRDNTATVSASDPYPSPTEQAAAFPLPTKSTNCEAKSSLPDSACTPGTIIANVSKKQVCTPGYSKSVRKVSTTTKTQVYEHYGIMSHATGQYEVDHLISLELGGSNDIGNLWPEAALPLPGFHQKDSEENYLHDQVCLGKMSLGDAQHIIASNWLAFYINMAKPASESILPVE